MNSNHIPEKLLRKHGVILYMDFLGMGKVLSSNKEDGTDINVAQDISGIYNEAIRMINQVEKYTGKKIKQRIFSDNIVVCFEFDKGNKTDYLNRDEMLWRAINFAASFQGAAFRKGYVLRGGISEGYYAINDHLVWGKALVDAIDLEEKVAIYPRIVLDNSITYDLIHKRSGMVMREVREDFDGLLFVDYRLDFLTDGVFINKKIEEFEIKFKEEKDTSVKAKYGWIVDFLKSDMLNLQYGFYEQNFKILSGPVIP